jgi:hypothetical protein
MNSYRIYRQLRFRCTWLTVVSATTETLNRICNHPAVNAGTPLKVRVTGLPTIEHVERHTAAVMNGTVSLDDIFHKVLLPRHLVDGCDVMWVSTSPVRGNASGSALAPMRAAG